MADSSIKNTKTCERCGATAEAVRKAESLKLVGFYCPTCRHYDKAIGRERKL
jgi:Zn finger protein HypA/HybF involved in hydrogenase expression